MNHLNRRKGREFTLSRKPQQGRIAWYFFAPMAAGGYIAYQKNLLGAQLIDWTAFPNWLIPIAFIVSAFWLAYYLAKKVSPVHISPERGLIHQPLEEIILRFLATMILGAGTWGFLWIVFSVEEMVIKVSVGIFACLFVYITATYLWKLAKRIRQYFRFGTSTLVISTLQPQLGESFHIRLEEAGLITTGGDVEIAFRNVSERYIQQGHKKRNKTTVIPYFPYESILVVPVMKICNHGIDLKIPQTDVFPTNYDPYQPDYWEVVITHQEAGLEVRFLVWIN